VLDVGCGTGYHLPRFAAEAERVVGVEPHQSLVTAARRRVAGLDRVTVLPGSAQALPLPDASVDIVHARLAYFFDTGCEPGLRELSRVVRRGGAAFIIDNDPTRSTSIGGSRRPIPESLRRRPTGSSPDMGGRTCAGTCAGGSSAVPTSKPCYGSSSEIG
ncbi:MAG: class I SAM-dependent methyltransferase, partial [Nocardioidaceae bacterium]